jgi:hypothetical protein
MEKSGMKKNRGMSLITLWFEEEMSMNRNTEQNIEPCPIFRAALEQND